MKKNIKICKNVNMLKNETCAKKCGFYKAEAMPR